MKRKFLQKGLVVAATASLVLFVLLPSCRHEPVIPAQQVSFSQDVLPVLAGNCAEPGCHGGKHHSLMTYSSVIKKVTPGDPHNSEIYQYITAQPPARVMPIPPNPPLQPAQIDIIYVWILQGAKDN